jgi:hypothetical protein
VWGRRTTADRLATTLDANGANAAQRDTFALTRESHEQWLARSGAAETSDQSQ